MSAELPSVKSGTPFERLWPAAAYQFCLIASLALLKPAANALVLSRFSSGAMPWLYLGAALSTAAVAAYTASRGGRLWSLVRLSFIGALVIVALTGALALEGHAMALLAWVFAEALGTSASLAFWATMSDVFDAREARRAYTLINGLGMLGAVMGGLLAQLLAEAAGTMPLMVGSAVLLAAGAVVFRAQPRPVESRRRRTDNTTAWSTVRHDAYARDLALVVLGFAVLSVMGDYLFRQRASAALDEKHMAVLFASLQLWTGIFCAGFQLLLAERMLRQVGIFRYLALVPGLLAALAGATLFDTGLTSSWALKLFEGSAMFSLVPVAMQLLYAPLKDDVRDGVRSVIDGFLRKGGLAVGGVLLLLTQGFASYTVSVISLAVACAGLGLLLVRLQRGYVSALQHQVAGVGSAQLGFAEESLLSQALKLPDPDRVLKAIAMFHYAELSLSPYVKALLTHPHERVRERAVELAVEEKMSSVAPQLERLIQSADRRPREAAVWALAKLKPERAKVLLPARLDSRDIGMRCAAAGALLSLGEHPAAQATVDALLANIYDAGPAERREVASLLGRLGQPRWEAKLERYLQDPDESVRRVALAAVGQGRYLALAPKVVRFLSSAAERRVAREALSRLGEGVVPLLAQVLDDRHQPVALRSQVPRVLRQIGSQSSLQALLFSNARDDAFLHYRVGTAIARLRDAQPELDVDEQRVMEALERRLATYRLYSGPYRDVRAALGEVSLLSRALGDRLDQAFELTFSLLGLLHDARAMRRAHAHLTGIDRRRRAYALELLDQVLTSEQRALVEEPISVHHRELDGGDPDRLAACLVTLSEGDDPVLRTCAKWLRRRLSREETPWNEAAMSEVTVKRLFALENVELFAQCDVDDLAAVAAVAREQAFALGDRVYAEGDPGDAVYVIVDGVIEARREGELVLTFGPGEVFGELCLFDGAPRVADMIVTKALQTLVIDRRDFLDLMSERPQLLQGVFRVMSRQLKSVVMDLPSRRGLSGETRIPDEVD